MRIERDSVGAAVGDEDRVSVGRNLVRVPVDWRAPVPTGPVGPEQGRSVEVKTCRSEKNQRAREDTWMFHKAGYAEFLSFCQALVE